MSNLTPQLHHWNHLWMYQDIYGLRRLRPKLSFQRTRNHSGGCLSWKVSLGYVWLQNFATRRGCKAWRWTRGWNTLTLCLVTRCMAWNWKWIQAVQPPWTVLLTYEHRLRKEAFKLVVAGTDTLAQALQHVVKDSDIKERYFTTPIALGVGFTSQQTGDGKWRKMAGKGQRFSSYGTSKGFGKGNNKGFGKSKGKHKGSKGSALTRNDNHNVLGSKTPDGRELRFAFNSQGCKNKCGRVHACRVKECIRTHSVREHHKYAKNAAVPKRCWVTRTWSAAYSWMFVFIFKETTKGWYQALFASICQFTKFFAKHPRSGHWAQPWRWSDKFSS